jgi:trans-2,3-dihydro-3-hydroxyanthranilate isomerase
MPTFPFMQVDAFTDRPLGGNPCAIVFDADSLDDATMQAIAREMNLSETAFVVPAAARCGAW